MKRTHRRRWMALLLTLAMCLTLVPAAWAAEGGASDPEIEIHSSLLDGHTMEPGQSTTLVARTIADQNPVTAEWVSDNEDIATVGLRTGEVFATGAKAGNVTITAYYGEQEATYNLVVSGINVEPPEGESEITIYENGDPLTLTDYVKSFGNASSRELSFSSRDTYTAEIVNRTQVQGLRVGTATIEAVSGIYTTTFTVTVEPDPTTRIPENENETLPLKSGEVLRFRDLASAFASQIGGKLEYVTGLLVSTDQGTLYYNYRSESEPGAGVGQVETYYRSPGPGQRALEDVTFVPKPGFVGGEVTITYNAITSEGSTYSCKIVLTVQGGSGSGSEAGGISLTTSYDTAVQFSSLEFGRVCRENLGVQLDYVIFAQPPERQGTLYTNYSNSSSYGSVVDVHRQYSRREVDDVWFVPAPGFSSGTVTVYYTGFGTNGRSYSGQVLISVGEEDSVTTGGLSYTVAPGSVVRFDDEDFDAYCKAILDSTQTINGIRFESLPSASEGVLYYDYQSASNPGTPVAAGTIYYSGARTPRINWLVFVPAEGFTGTLRIPFTGWTADLTSFGGNVDIIVSSSFTSGDIYYSCAPGKSVSFVSSDFADLSRSMTNSTLDYIRFLDVPGESEEGYLYYGNSRITSTGTSYSNSNINRLSFRASSRFTGPVNISFEGYSRYGDRFTGIVTIGTSGTGSGGTGISSNSIPYTTDSKNAAVFYRDDFDNLSQWETDQDISSIRINSSDLPSSSQGSLYQNYRSSSNMGTRITSSTTITASNLDRLAFVPASGYTGTVYINFTGTAAGNGGTFYGTVEIEVGQPAADVTARYSTRTAPVRFYAGDLARSGSSLSSIQFTSLPSPAAGYLYSQYTSPIRYGQRASTVISYRTSGSNLISDLAFVPRAGYTGTVTIPYTGSNSSGTTFTGEVVITVSPSYGSTYFNDMTSYNNSQRAAVDFLYDYNITRGVGSGQYGPENSIRRGDFARMLYLAFEFSPASSGTFADVSPSAYYAEAVNALYARGIVSGVGNGYYAPDSPLTRQDAICMVQRAMQAVGWNASDGYASALSGYGDSGNVSGYAQGAMALAVQRGYLPTTGGWLNPQQPLTRVDMAEILHRVLTY